MFIKSYWKAVVWFLLIMLLSVLSTNKLPDVDIQFEHTDKLAHFIMYFIFSYLIMEGYHTNQKGPRSLAVVMALLIPAVVGLVTEFMQVWLTSTREGDPMDFVANLLGAISGILFFGKLYPLQLSFQNWLKKIVTSG